MTCTFLHTKVDTMGIVTYILSVFGKDVIMKRTER